MKIYEILYTLTDVSSVYQYTKVEVAVAEVEEDEEDVAEVEVVEEEEEVDLILLRQKGVVALQHFLEPK